MNNLTKAKKQIRDNKEFIYSNENGRCESCNTNGPVWLIPVGFSNISVYLCDDCYMKEREDNA